LLPNDVVVILRPSVVDNEWDGSFDVMVSGIGPITIAPKDMDKMVGMGVVLASVVPLLENDRETAQIIINHCNKNFSELGDFEYDVPNTGVLNKDTKCTGGLQ
jgi:hypothetical protein